LRASGLVVTMIRYIRKVPFGALVSVSKGSESKYEWSGAQIVCGPPTAPWNEGPTKRGGFNLISAGGSALTSTPYCLYHCLSRHSPWRSSRLGGNLVNLMKHPGCPLVLCCHYSNQRCGGSCGVSWTISSESYGFSSSIDLDFSAYFTTHVHLYT
jgi:hypothetical protein